MNFGMSNFSYCGICHAKLEFSNFSSLGNITSKTPLSRRKQVIEFKYLLLEYGFNQKKDYVQNRSPRPIIDFDCHFGNFQLEEVFCFQSFLDVSKRKGEQQPPSLVDKFGYNFDREGILTSINWLHWYMKSFHFIMNREASAYSKFGMAWNFVISFLIGAFWGNWLVYWKCCVICKVHKKKRSMPSELRVVVDWCRRDIV